MPTYTEETLTKVWRLVKEGARKRDIMKSYDCTEIEAIEVYDQACKRFGRGPRKIKPVRDKSMHIDSRRPVRIERPKAVYSNDGYLNILNKYQ
jgi:hypothetical protein